MYYGSKNESRRRAESSLARVIAVGEFIFVQLTGDMCVIIKKKGRKKEKRAKKKGEKKRKRTCSPMCIFLFSLSLSLFTLPSVYLPRGVLRNTEAMIRQDVALCATPRYDARTCQWKNFLKTTHCIYLRIGCATRGMWKERQRNRKQKRDSKQEEFNSNGAFASDW